MFDVVIVTSDDEGAPAEAAAVAPPPPPPAVAAPAVAVPAVAAPALDRRLYRLAFRRGAKKARRAEQQRDAAVAVCSPTVREGISRDIFGFNPQLKGNFRFSSGTTLDPATTITVDRRRQRGRMQRRGLGSHVEATRESLVRFVQRVRTLVHVDVTDEATMWGRKPETKADRRARNASDARNHRRGRKGGKRLG